MDKRSEDNDVVIVGGGLAGLSLACLLAERKLSVTVVEREHYPRHKVCGEFISRESLDFLQRTGVIKPEDNFPVINQFELTFPNGKSHKCELNPGGIGISRFTIDHRLYQLAVKKGANVILNDRASSIVKNEDGSFCISLKSGLDLKCKVPVIATGRYSKNLQPFEIKSDDRMSWFGVKYHIELPMSKDLIRILMFKGGYAGVSAIDNGKYCFCYLAKTKLLKKYKGNIPVFEKEVIRRNPEIESLLTKCRIVEGPFTTSGFRFGFHKMEKDGILFCGDSGGFIPPLTGNGMSLAFRSAVILGPLIHDYITEKIDWEDLKITYQNYGENYLKKRISSGIFLQQLALDPAPIVQRILSNGMSLFPFLLKNLSRKASGNQF